MRLKWIDQAQFVGHYLANSEGLYTKEGLKVTVNAGGPDVSPIQMVVSGVDDFGITGADQILMAREKGVPIVAIAVIYKNTPVAIGSLKGKNILALKDLENKKVGLIYGRDEETIYRALIAKGAINKESINEVPLLSGLGQLTSGDIDAQILYEINEPILLEQQGFEVNLIKPRDYGLTFYSDTIFTTEDMINNHPEIVQGFLRATIMGWTKSFDDPKKAIDIVMGVNSTLDRTHQEKFLALSTPLINEDGKIGYSDKQVWENMQQILLDQKLLTSSVDIDKVFTNKFVE